MSTVGEAASLFGSTDTANDPFASTLGSSPDTNTFPAGSDLFSGQDTSSAADLFGSVNNTGGPGASSDYTSNDLSALGGYDNSWTSPSQQNTYNTSGTSGSNEYMSQAYTNGWNGQEAEWSSSQRGSTGAYAPYANVSHTAPQHSYEPYASYAAQPSSPNAYTPYTSAIPETHTASTTYAPYAPPIEPQVVNTYNPTQPASVSQSALDPYKSSQAYIPQQPQTKVDAPQRSHANATGTASIVNTPAFTAGVPPPLPSASAYRPKTSNAYDPPLPPPKASKRAHAWQPQHSAAVHTPYTHESGPTPPILSPPPAPRGVSRRHFASPPPQHVTQPPNYFALPPQPASHGIPEVPHNSLPPPPAGAPFSGNHTAIPPPAVPTHDAYVHSSQFFDNANLISNQTTYTPANQILPNGQAITASLSHTNEAASLTSEHLVADDRICSPPPVYGTDHFYEPAQRASATSQPSLRNTPQSDLGIEEEASTAHEWVDDSHTTDFSHAQTAGPHAATDNSQSYAPPSNISSSFQPVYDPYRPNGASSLTSLSRSQSPERVRSPGSSSVRSRESSKRQSAEITAKKRADVVSPPPQHMNERSPPSIARAYDPPPITGVQRTASPSTFSVRSVNSRESVIRDPYAPSEQNMRNRSMSNSSAFSSTSTTAKDPYAPSLHPRQQSLDSSSYGMSPMVQFQPALVEGVSYTPSTSVSYDRAGSQVLSVAARATHTPYAPSPSLLGTNDPLGRTSVRVPVISFGFGGKIVTCFHGASSLNTGFDVALSSRQSTDVQLRILHKVIPQSALDTSAASYPGPLFSDPGTPTAIISRTGAATQTKTKKARVIKYLEERADEISRGIGYLHQGSVEGKRADAKHTLIMLLKVMVENDGRLSGSTQIDAAVRAALLPSLSSSDAPVESLKTGLSLGATGLPDLSATSYPSLVSTFPDPSDATIAVHTLRSSHLDKIHDLLVRGERRAAFQYAADEKLWAHAMVIASSIDKEAWKEVVSEFVRAELHSKDAGSLSLTRGSTAPTSDGREPLRVAYNLFAGQGAASVQELLPPKLLGNAAQMLQLPQIPPPSAITPMTPNFPLPVQTGPIPPQVLSKWAETAAMMISSPMTTESSSALTALGDHLAANNWVEASHVCYLLSPQTSPIGGVGTPSGRVLLYGAPNPSSVPNFWKDPDPIIFSEIVEFALSLATPAKGQEAFAGLPHLQAYRLIHAMSLAELGHDQLANRYCEAISSSLSRTSPYIHATLVEQLRLLSDRLIAAPQVDKSGSWIGGKMTRPSLDKLSNWLEGRLSNFIVGDGDSPKTADARAKDKTFSGPFAHYSAISSATSSTMPSPRQSIADLTEVPTPPYRTGSAMALRPSNAAQVQINRASSAMDHIRRKASPVPRVSSASAATTSFPDSSPFRQLSNGYSSLNESTPRASLALAGTTLTESFGENGMTPDPNTEGPHTASWWGSDSGAPTPTASTFTRVNAPLPASTDGFISLMDDPVLSMTPSAPARAFNPMDRSNSMQSNSEVDDDDLGLGNSSSRTRRAESSGFEEPPSSAPAPAKVEPPKEQEKSEAKHAASGGWLSRLWKRNEDPAAPVKANLGEKTSFYYDKELKRWIDPNAPPPAKPAAPPPPPRAQTASPGSSLARLNTGPSPAPPPPARPATAIDLSESPPKRPPMRVRSNLVPSDTASAPTTPASATMSPMDPPGLNGPPTPGVRAKVHAKRNVRNRYVDVFQQ